MGSCARQTEINFKPFLIVLIFKVKLRIKIFFHVADIVHQPQFTHPIIRLSKEYNNSFFSYSVIYMHVMNIYAMKCKCEESVVVSMVECIYIRDIISLY